MRRASMRTYGQRMWALSLRSQFCVALTIGSAAAFTVLGAGLALIKFHGGIWPWWFHGICVALITGLITTLLTYLHVREVSRREARRLAGELMSHEVCTALQILLQCKYLQPNQRTKLESEAIERLRVAAREILPNLLEMSANMRPAPLSSPDEAEEQRKDGDAKGLE